MGVEVAKTWLADGNLTSRFHRVLLHSQDVSFRRLANLHCSWSTWAPPKMIYQDTDNQLLTGHMPVGISAGISGVSPSESGVVSSLAMPTSGFSETENPYLFPCNLLDSWADESAKELSCDKLSGNVFQEGNVPQETVSASCPAELDPIDQPRWWLIHSKPRQEKKLAEELRRLQVPHFLPVTKCKAVTRGRARFSQQPQFPGYLFLWADQEQRRAALETNRVVATYQAGCHKRLGRHLWDLADLIEKGVSLRIEERLAAGQSVRVKSGLLKDKRGVIIKRGGKSRLFIFVSEMLGGVSLEVEQHLLEPY